jgi:hypothetical protein
MATTQITEYPAVVPASRPFMWSWAGIFCGAFMYIAIESTFGLLGTAIFATESNPAAGIPTSATPSMATGLQVWMIVLSIIALYFAGKTSSKLLYGNADRNLGMYHGMVTFGMCFLATILIVGFATAGAAATGATHNIGTFINSNGEWWLFVAFILSMCSAAIGGIHGVRRTPTATVDRSTTTRMAA